MRSPPSGQWTPFENHWIRPLSRDGGINRWWCQNLLSAQCTLRHAAMKCATLYQYHNVCFSPFLNCSFYPTALGCRNWFSAAETLSGPACIRCLPLWGEPQQLPGYLDREDGENLQVAMNSCYMFPTRLFSESSQVFIVEIIWRESISY